MKSIEERIRDFNKEWHCRYCDIGTHTKCQKDVELADADLQKFIDDIVTEVIGENEEPKYVGHRAFNQEFVSTRNWVRKEQRTRYAAMKQSNQSKKELEDI